MLDHQFFNATGLSDFNLALTVDVDLKDFIQSSEWMRVIDNGFHIEDHRDFYIVRSGEKEVILINEESLNHLSQENSDFLHVLNRKNLIVFRKKNKISDTTRRILTEQRIPLIDIPVPKAENECAKSMGEKYFCALLIHSDKSLRNKIIYDVFINLIVKFILSLLGL